MQIFLLSEGSNNYNNNNNGGFHEGVRKKEIQQWRRLWSGAKVKKTHNFTLREKDKNLIGTTWLHDSANRLPENVFPT